MISNKFLKRIYKKIKKYQEKYFRY